MPSRATQAKIISLAALAATAALLMPLSMSRADELARHRGRCQSLTIFDQSTSRACVDEMLVQVGASGERGFVFLITDGTVVLFVGPDQPPDLQGTRAVPVARVGLGVRTGETETIVARSGVCRSEDPAASWRVSTICEAETDKGRFAAQFVTIDGAVEPLLPNDTGARPR